MSSTSLSLKPATPGTFCAWASLNRRRTAVSSAASNSHVRSSILPSGYASIRGINGFRTSGHGRLFAHVTRNRRTSGVELTAAGLSVFDWLFGIVTSWVVSAAVAHPERSALLFLRTLGIHAMTSGRLVRRPARQTSRAFLASRGPIHRCPGRIATPAPNQPASANRLA